MWKEMTVLFIEYQVCHLFWGFNTLNWQANCIISNMGQKSQPNVWLKMRNQNESKLPSLMWWSDLVFEIILQVYNVCYNHSTTFHYACMLWMIACVQGIPQTYYRTVHVTCWTLLSENMSASNVLLWKYCDIWGIVAYYSPCHNPSTIFFCASTRWMIACWRGLQLHANELITVLNAVDAARSVNDRSSGIVAYSVNVISLSFIVGYSYVILVKTMIAQYKLYVSLTF